MALEIFFGAATNLRLADAAFAADALKELDRAHITHVARNLLVNGKPVAYVSLFNPILASALKQLDITCDPSPIVDRIFAFFWTSGRFVVQTFLSPFLILFSLITHLAKTNAEQNAYVSGESNAEGIRKYITKQQKWHAGKVTIAIGGNPLDVVHYFHVSDGVKSLRFYIPQEHTTPESLALVACRFNTPVKLLFVYRCVSGILSLCVLSAIWLACFSVIGTTLFLYIAAPSLLWSLMNTYITRQASINAIASLLLSESITGESDLKPVMRMLHLQLASGFRILRNWLIENLMHISMDVRTLCSVINKNDVQGGFGTVVKTLLTIFALPIIFCGIVVKLFDLLLDKLIP
ncbi:MAG: hypothetical protein LBC42_00345 [Puniceicoccales bacterium]|nr:hypothetical protein [Puniceicoccales bacterium]